MTNLDKFKQVFGFEPDPQSSVIKCPDMQRETACPYCNEDLPIWQRQGCHCEDWWREEYKYD